MIILEHIPRAIFCIKLRDVHVAVPNCDLATLTYTELEHAHSISAHACGRYYRCGRYNRTICSECLALRSRKKTVFRASDYLIVLIDHPVP